MAKRELIDRNDLENTTITTDDYSGNEVLDVVLMEDVKETPVITEQEIVKPYLEKLKEQIAKSADKQLKIAMGTADLNERYAHIRVESAFRQCIAMIDNLLSESEG